MFATAARLPGLKAATPTVDTGRDLTAVACHPAAEFDPRAAAASIAARDRMLRASEVPAALGDWERALFIHFAVDPAVLQPHVPFPLDLHGGLAYVSIVAFTQTNVRPRFARRLGAWADRVAALGAAPVTEHPFLNLRTYVRDGTGPNAERGIYFLAEWIPNLLDRVIGPAFYGLPYRLGRLAYRYDESGRPLAGEVAAGGKRLSFEAGTEGDAEPASAPAGLERFLVERYTAFTGGTRGRAARWFRIWHAPWPLVAARVTVKETGLLDAAAPWFGACRLVGGSFSPGVKDVWIGPPRKVGGRALLFTAVVPTALLAAGPALALLFEAPAWALMWAIAFAMFFAWKWVTFRRVTVLPLPLRERAGVRGERKKSRCVTSQLDSDVYPSPQPSPARGEGAEAESPHSDPLPRGERGPDRRALGYLFAWVGMDAERFLDRTRRPPRPTTRDWAGAFARTLAGAALVWVGVRLLAPAHPFAAAWAGMVGLAMLLHFGSFHLLALAWRRAGVDATPLMDSPSRSRSLAEFWSARWNRGFHRLAETFVFRPAVRRLRVRPAGAMLLTFLASGLVHDAVISLPARGGWGLPTLYFLIQGGGVLLERSAFGRRAGLGAGLRGRAFALVFTIAPLPLLFHGAFVDRVIVPFLDAIGAT